MSKITKDTLAIIVNFAFCTNLRRSPYIQGLLLNRILLSLMVLKN